MGGVWVCAGRLHSRGFWKKESLKTGWPIRDVSMGGGGEPMELAVEVQVMAIGRWKRRR